MASKDLKPVKRKKYYKGRALISLDSTVYNKYDKQHRYAKRKSILYNNARFEKYGPELGIINHLAALDSTITVFNERYGDTLLHRHAILIVLIKHYLVTTSAESFKADDIFHYYPFLKGLFSFYIHRRRTWLHLIQDLTILHFINPLGRNYKPTMRLQLFCSEFEKQCKKLFTDQNQ